MIDKKMLIGKNGGSAPSLQNESATKETIFDRLVSVNRFAELVASKSDEISSILLGGGVNSGNGNDSVSPLDAGRLGQADRIITELYSHLVAIENNLYRIGDKI